MELSTTEGDLMTSSGRAADEAAGYDSGFLDLLRAASADAPSGRLGMLTYETVRSVYDAVKFGVPFAVANERELLAPVSDAANDCRSGMFELDDRHSSAGPAAVPADRVGRAARRAAGYLDSAGRGRLLLDSVEALAASVMVADRPTASAELDLLALVNDAIRDFARRV